MQTWVKNVKVRKPHKCYGCLNTIEKGQLAKYVTNADGGTFLNSYWCKVCEAVIQKYDLYDSNDDGFDMGEIIENMPEEWEEMRKEME